GGHPLRLAHFECHTNRRSLRRGLCRPLTGPALAFEPAPARLSIVGQAMSTRSSHHLPLISRSRSGEYRCCAWQHGLRLYFPNESEIVGWSPLAPVPPEFRPSFRFDRVGDRWGFGAGVRYQLMLRSRSLVRALLTSTVAAAIALAGCTSDGTPASTENSGTIGSLVRNLFGIKSEDQAAVAHNDRRSSHARRRPSLRPPSRNIPRWQRRALPSQSPGRSRGLRLSRKRSRLSHK